MSLTSLDDKNSPTKNYFLFSLAIFGGFSLLSKSSKFIQSIYPLMVPRPNLIKTYGKNSWVAITGSSDGLGKQFAHEFSAYGFNCLLIARNELKIKKVEAELKTKFPHIAYKITIADFQKVLEDDFTKNIEKEFKSLDIKILVNNVGVANVSNFFSSNESENKQEIFINSYSTVLLSKLFINTILEKRKSENSGKYAIINIGSILGNIPLPYLSIYCGTKAFVNNFSESLYYEFKEKNINIFCLTPYYVSTKMTGFKKLTFDTITPEECVSSAIKQFAKGKKTSSGNWKHELISLMLGSGYFKEYLIKKKKDFYKDLVDRAEKINQLRKNRPKK